ncbi:MAG: DUF971 domain-containing protein [Anaerolineae bacterium]|nr:DUF971 domain-containing protein [Anaerolineae bacterium]
MTEPIPTAISADRKAQELTIDWDDDVQCVYKFELLRNSCPCAQCRGGHENMSSEPEEDMLVIPLMNVNTTRLKEIKAMGNYALNLAWEDGHNHGIYTWHYLRALCALQEQDADT